MKRFPEQSMAHSVLVSCKLHTSCSQNPALQVTFALGAGSVQSCLVGAHVCGLGCRSTAAAQRDGTSPPSSNTLQQHPRGHLASSRAYCVCLEGNASPLSILSHVSALQPLSPLLLLVKKSQSYRNSYYFSVSLPDSPPGKSKEITENPWVTDRYSHTVCHAHLPGTRGLELLPRKMQKNQKTYKKLHSHLPVPLQAQGYLTHLSSLF